MDLIDNIRQLSSRIKKIKDSILTEEATKMSLIIPFFQMLGYDVFNPEEFIAEFTADVGIKKGEKVDYAIVVNGKPSILIECKSCNTILDKHDSQLFRYFNTTTAKFAILTNGITYKFYTDLDEPNRMDIIPFLELDLEKVKDNIIPEIKKFHKDNFDPDSILSSASELKYAKLIQQIFQEELDNPSKDFSGYFIDKIYDGHKTQTILEKFTPIIKKSLNNLINEKMNEKIQSALETNSKLEKSNIPSEKTIVINMSPKEIVTTEKEIEAFYLIKSILNGIIDLTRISYKDTLSYIAIIVDDMVTHWICRIKLDGTAHYIIIPDENNVPKKFYIKSLDEIFKYKDSIIKSASRFAKETETIYT